MPHKIINIYLYYLYFVKISIPTTTTYNKKEIIFLMGNKNLFFLIEIEDRSMIDFNFILLF